MGPFGLKIRFLAAFVAALAVLAGLGILSYRRAVQEAAEQKWVTHTRQVIEELNALQTSLLDQQIARLRYFETGEAAFAAESSARRAELIEHISNLKTLTSDNPSQQENLRNLEPLIEVRRALFHEAQNQKDRSSSESRDQELLQQCRGLISAMKQEEQNLLPQRQQAAASVSRRTKALLVAGNVTALSLLFVAGLLLLSDISRRDRSQRELKAAEHRYHELFERNPLPMWVYNKETLAFLDVNSAAIAHYGYSRDEFLRLKIADIRPGEELSALKQSVEHSPEAVERSGPWKHRTKSGEVIEVEISSYPLVFKGADARLVVAIDVTERQRAEDALRRSEERFRLMVSNVRDYAIFMLDPEGRVASWNAGAERLKGYRAEEIVGQHFSRFYLAEEVKNGKPERELEQTVANGRFEDEGWRVRKNGSRFWANVIVTALYDDAGQLRGFGKVTRDITERKRAEREILRRTVELEAANKELEAFSYSVSHDLRAPLRAIDGFSLALQEDYSAGIDEKGQDYLRRVRSATQRMGLLIDDLLNLARVSRAEMRLEPVDITGMARTVVGELRAANPERRVDVEICPGLSAEGDVPLVRIALENLIGNAWKFTSKRETARIEVGAASANGTRTFYVRDDGAGFDQAHADRLFSPFQRLHGMSEFPGTGIGLATVQRIIHRHGGKVWAEGAVGKGATFYFTL